MKSARANDIVIKISKNGVVQCCARTSISVLGKGTYVYKVYEMDENTNSKDRTAMTGSESGREVAALEEAAVEEAELIAEPVTEGDVEAAGEEVGIDDVANRDENELEDESEFDENNELDKELAGFVAEDVVGGREVSTLPTTMVVPIVFAEVCVSEVGIETVDVAEARGEENEPDIPLRLRVF